MAEKNRKRAYGCGEIIELSDGRRAIRWREKHVDAKGKSRTRKRYETLGKVSISYAAKVLNEKLRKSEVASKVHVPVVTFKEHAERWMRDILPNHKPSVRLGCAGVLKSHLIPRFGDVTVNDLSQIAIQEWASELRERNYAPKSIRNYHGVLSMVMNAAKDWYALERNPAHGVKLGRKKLVRKKWALTPDQARPLLGRLALKPRTMVALDITTSLRRGEIEAVRWKRLEDSSDGRGVLTIVEHHYEGEFDDPKTEDSIRRVIVPAEVMALLQEWKRVSKHTKPEDYIFATRNGTPERGKNILRRHVYPACAALGLPRADWLTFRRTFDNWCHKHQIPAKDIAEMMGHSDVPMQFVYTVGMEENKRLAADCLGKELGSLNEQLGRIGQFVPNSSEAVN
ncbi:MAG TPA: tyrosine-type recombinase/integrase [Terriglobia bacterium]|nr:tyrosine-type recombinase/integrase [Terriglobia bacterium]